ncbi:MAG: hypothetical protein KDA25_05550 [Phycisphaerales bacterium]|nr:hypothetical protein [Phycisphaerales bacterium]
MLNVALIVLIVSLACLAAGAPLAIRGWRGRRVDDLPYCRRCAYCLAGHDPLPESCPECGHTLARGVRAGRRERRRVMLGAGVFLLVVGLAGSGLFVVSRLNRVDWNTYKPFAWLMLEADAGNANTSMRAIDELRQRFVAGQLAPDQRSRFIDWTIAHTDPDAAFTGIRANLLDDVIDWSVKNDLLTDEQHRAMLEHGCAAHTTVTFRTRIAKGAPIPMRVLNTAPGVAVFEDGDVRIEITMTALTIDGVPRSDASYRRRWDVRHRNSISSDGLIDARDLDPGAHEIVTTWRQTITVPTTSGDLVETFEFTRSSTVTIVDGATIAMIEATPESSAAVRDSIHVNLVDGIVAVEHTTWADHSGMVLIVNPPVGVAFDVFARTPDGVEHVLGTLVAAAGGNAQTHLRAPLRERFPGVDRIDLVFRPNADLAAGTIDLESIWGAEIVLDDVALK